MKKQHAIFLLFVSLMTVNGCLAPSECSDDSECADGLVCSMSFAGAYEVSVCTMPLEGTIAIGCNQECANAATIVAEAVTCKADFLEVCALVCSGDGEAPTGTLKSCDGDMQNGCEIDTSTDPENCGGCTGAGDGVDCNALFAAGNTTGSCVAGACVFEGCAEGWRTLDSQKRFELGCDLAFDKNQVQTGPLRITEAIGLVRAQGVSVAVNAAGDIAWLPDDTGVNSETMKSAALAQVTHVRGAELPLNRQGGAVLSGTDGTNTAMAEVIIWDGTSPPQIIDTLDDVLIAEFVPSMRSSEERELYPWDVFAISPQGTLTWYAYLLTGDAPLDVFGEDKSCTDLGTALLGGLKRCTVGTVTDLNTLLATPPRPAGTIAALRARPFGDVIVLTAADGQEVREVRAFLKGDSGVYLRSLDEIVSTPPQAGPAAVYAAEVWRDEAGAKGVVFAGGAGTTLELEFMEISSDGRNADRASRKMLSIEVNAAFPKLSLARYGADSRYIASIDDGIFVGSSRDGEGFVRLSEAKDTGWDAAGTGTNATAIARNSQLVILPAP